MAYVRIVTRKRGTTIRNIKMNGYTIQAVDQAATSMESIIHDELSILKVEVDYTDCRATEVWDE